MSNEMAMVRAQAREVAVDAIKSGLFGGYRTPEAAAMAIVAGGEMGLTPAQSLMQFHIINGRPIMSSGLLAALIKRSGRYRYRVTEHTREACTIVFFERDAQGCPWEQCGESRYTMEDAQAAGATKNPTWKAHPRNMLFARALSNGAKWFCGDATMGAVYVDGEIEEEEPAHRPAPRRVVTIEAVEPDPEIDPVEALSDAAASIADHVGADPVTILRVIAGGLGTTVDGLASADPALIARSLRAAEALAADPARAAAWWASKTRPATPEPPPLAPAPDGRDWTTVNAEAHALIGKIAAKIGTGKDDVSAQVHAGCRLAAGLDAEHPWKEIPVAALEALVRDLRKIVADDDVSDALDTWHAGVSESSDAEREFRRVKAERISDLKRDHRQDD